MKSKENNENRLIKKSTVRDAIEVDCSTWEESGEAKQWTLGRFQKESHIQAAHQVDAANWTRSKHHTLEQLYDGCRSRLKVGVHGDAPELFSKPEVWTIIWAVLINFILAGGKKAARYLLNDIFGKETITADEVYGEIDNIGGQLQKLKKAFERQEGLLEEIQEDLKQFDTQQLESNVVENLVQHNWDQPKTEKGVKEVIEELKGEN